MASILSNNAQPNPLSNGSLPTLMEATAQLAVALAGLRFSQVRFALALHAPLVLPTFYASMLRGGLGLHFRRLVCVQPQLKQCRDCTLLRHCAYPAVFETPLPLVLANAPHLQEVSPYLLLPVTPAQTVQAGERLLFDLRLFGKASSYLPYFVISYRQLGLKDGMGRERAHFDLEQVIDETPGHFAQTLYARQSGNVNIQPQSTTLQTLLPTRATPVRAISVEFLTPTRIKTQSKITHAPTFRELCAALLRRLAQIVMVHGEQAWTVPEEPLLTAAEQIATVRSDLRVVDWVRYSSRQEQQIHMGGVMGEVVFQGDLQPFVPLLWAGQFLHVGRGTTFGNGQYRLRING